MLISTATKYALGLMMDLAEHEGEEPVKLKNVAERKQLSLKYLERISVIMKKKGLIYSYRGYHGGYRMRLQPGECTVGMIIRAAEGENKYIQDSRMWISEKHCESDYVTDILCKKLLKAVNDVADDITVQDLIRWKEE